jgi:acyl-coenzyme A thioesterase PaaI-like protein
MIAESSFPPVEEPYFTLVDESGSTTRYLAGPATSGPWDARLQHGGPPNALAVTAAERAVSAATGRTDLVALRLAADFIGPVPVGEFDATTAVLRTARSAALVEVTVSADGRPCLSARVWFVRTSDTSEIAAPSGEPVPVPDVPSGLDFSFGYGSSLEWRFVKNRMGVPGPAAAWVRPMTPLLAGHEMSGLARVALIADSGSGISAELDWAQWSFLNVDLDVHLARPVAGEWVLMDAATQLGPAGSALARSTLSDVRGEVGSALQTLVLAPLPTRQ